MKLNLDIKHISDSIDGINITFHHAGRNNVGAAINNKVQFVQKENKFKAEAPKPTIIKRKRPKRLGRTIANTKNKKKSCVPCC